MVILPVFTLEKKLDRLDLFQFFLDGFIELPDVDYDLLRKMSFRIDDPAHFLKVLEGLLQLSMMISNGFLEALRIFLGLGLLHGSFPTPILLRFFVLSNPFCSGGVFPQ